VLAAYEDFYPGPFGGKSFVIGEMRWDNIIFVSNCDDGNMCAESCDVAWMNVHDILLTLGSTASSLVSRELRKGSMTAHRSNRHLHNRRTP